MAIDVWGMLQKSQIDPELIEQAIERWIKQHNNDEAAHIGEGRSLDQHKLSETIDHVVASVVADKIREGEVFREKLGFNKFYIRPTFESLDAWLKTGTGPIQFVPGCVWLETLNILNSYARLYSTSGFIDIDWRYVEAIYEAVVRLSGIANQIVHFGIGYADPDEVQNFIGFKIVNASIFGCWYSGGGEFTVGLPAVDVRKFHSYRWVLTPQEKIDFYIDNVLVTTVTNNLPDSSNIETLFFFKIKNTAAAYTRLIVVDASYLQSR